MTLTEFAEYLAGRIRAEGPTSPAIVAGLHLTTAAWAAIDPADIDTELRWGLAATSARAVLDTLDALPAHGIEVVDDPATNPDNEAAAAAAAVADLLTAIADAFTHAAQRPSPRTAIWYSEAADELRDAAAALT